MSKITISQRFKRSTDLFAFCYTDPELCITEHTHEFHELVIVDKGCAVNVLNGELYFIQEGDVFFVKSTDRHCYSELGTLKLMNILINPECPLQYLKQVDAIFSQLKVKSDTNFVWLMPEDKERCLALVDELALIYQTPSSLDEAMVFQIESIFMQILSIILISRKAIHKNSTQYKARSLLNYLQQNYATHIDWQWLSEHFFVTNKTMTRKIKELTGMSPVNYLNRLRLLSAREKLRQTDDLITDIAGNCGFISSDYFAKCYRKNFGITPSDERKMLSD